MLPWHDRWVLISGGTGGVGRTVSAHLADLGASIVVPFVDPAEADNLISTLSEASRPRIRLVAADLRQEKAVQTLVDGMPRVDALVHLTGGYVQAELDTMDERAWSEHYALNVTTTFLACKHTLRRMKSQGHGRIVTIGSRAAVEPGPQLGAYASAKAAVVALTRSIAAETKGTDITANCILPSIIDTPANRAAMGSDKAHRWVSPASLAEVIAFLASPAARDVRGAAIPVYGSA